MQNITSPSSGAELGHILAVAAPPHNRRPLLVTCAGVVQLKVRKRSDMLRRPDGPRIDPRRLASYGFVAGMVLAPFLALIYGLNAGLAVMACALAATTYLAYDTYRTAAHELQPRLRLLVAINAGLTLLCVGLLIARLL